MSEKRYAKVGDLVIHKRSGEMGRIVEVHAPNKYRIGGEPVSCPVAVLDSGTPFLDVPGKTLFEFLPDEVEASIAELRDRVDAIVSNEILFYVDVYKVDRQIALAIVGSVIRERMRKEN
jgi:hypothetical protein